MQIDPHVRDRIAAEAIVSPRTVQRAYSGAVSPYSRARIAAAAERLGVPVPPREGESHAA